MRARRPTDRYRQSRVRHTVEVQKPDTSWAASLGPANSWSASLQYGWLARIVGFVLILALAHGAVISANAPGSPTPTATGMVVEPAGEPQATMAPTPAPTVAHGAEAEPGATALPAGTVVPGWPAQAAAPSAASPPLPGTSHLAVLVSESVVSIGGTASSKVFVLIKDVQPGIQGFQLRLRFDPQIVHVADSDDDATNGTQVAVMAFPANSQARYPQLGGTQQVLDNQANNDTGEIALAVSQQGAPLLHQAQAWLKVATITWTGQDEGNSAIAIDNSSRFTAADGRLIAPDATHNGAVFVRVPGRIEGAVKLQGRTVHRDTLVASTLAATRVDETHTNRDGRFSVTASHGEGFYTLTAFAPGYLVAQVNRPVKLTVGSVIHLGEATLAGGDANGDNRIDIRDLAYVAYHVDKYDAKADINGDGRVDVLDLSLIAENFGQVGPTAWHIGG